MALSDEIRPPPPVRRMGDPLAAVLPLAVQDQLRPPPPPFPLVPADRSTIREALKALGWRGPTLNKEVNRLMGTSFFLILFVFFLF